MAAPTLQIRYTSGTGNTYRVTRWIAEHAKSLGCTVQALPIEAQGAAEVLRAKVEDAKGIVVEREDGSEASSNDKQPTVILATPTHGFTTPWHMLRFALSMPRGQGAATYCLATRAGFRIGSSYITDGIAGTCAFLLALVLTIKGYHVRGTVHVNMPSNWYSLHPIQGEKTVRMLLEQGIVQTRAFTEQVVIRQPVWLTKNNGIEAIWGLVLIPISALYLVFGRIVLAKLFFANSRCDGCGLCAKVCPTRSIAIQGKNNPRPYWRYSCESCMRCAAFCPKRAVEASHSWMALLWWISSVPAWAYLLIWMSEYLPWLRGLEQSWLSLPLKLIYTALVFIVPYYAFVLLLRVRVINWLFTHTTLTHYWGRYKEPAVKLAELRTVDSQNSIR